MESYRPAGQLKQVLALSLCTLDDTNHLSSMCKANSAFIESLQFESIHRNSSAVNGEDSVLADIIALINHYLRLN